MLKACRPERLLSSGGCILSKYADFLARKQSAGANTGFEPSFIPEKLFDFQKMLVDWIIRKGRGAVFADCGMGKTIIQLTWAQNVLRHTNKPVLVLTPLAVSAQTIDEAHKFGLDAQRADPAIVSKNIVVTNYEQLHKFDPNNFGGVVCDESSILKNFNGQYKSQITEFMRLVPYRSLFTATAAPNDWEELGTSSEALGYLGYTDMLSRFFTNKSNTVRAKQFQNQRDKFHLRHYAEKDFWQWVASWSRAARTPADLGFSNEGFVLPEMVENDIEVKAARPQAGALWDLEATNFFEEREAIRRTVNERCEAAAERVANHDISMVWCHTNAEADLLKRIIPNSIEVSGSDSPEKKEEAANWFVRGQEQKRVLISKPRIFGFGMNFQHCNHAVYFPTHSYEQYYQATRRIWRFGQTRPVIIDRIYTNGGRRMLESIERKSAQASDMFDNLVKNVNDNKQIENTYTKQEIEVPKWLSK